MATKYEFYDATENNGASTKLNTINGQLITIGSVGTNENFNITLLKLSLKKTGSPPTLYVSIRNVDAAGIPTGDDIATAILDASTLTTSYALTSFNIKPQILLEKDKRYAILIKCPEGDAYNDVDWRLDEGPYGGGDWVVSEDAGRTWTRYADNVFGFEVWGEIKNLEHIRGDTGGIRTKAIATRYPVTVGTTGGTTKQTGEKINLVATKGSFVPRRKRKGIEY